jgi:hypothetical protein
VLITPLPHPTIETSSLDPDLGLRNESTFICNSFVFLVETVDEVRD